MRFPNFFKFFLVNFMYEVKQFLLLLCKSLTFLCGLFEHLKMSKQISHPFFQTFSETFLAYLWIFFFKNLKKNNLKVKYHAEVLSRNKKRKEKHFQRNVPFLVCTKNVQKNIFQRKNRSNTTKQQQFQVTTFLQKKNLQLAKKILYQHVYEYHRLNQTVIDTSILKVCDIVIHL